MLPSPLHAARSGLTWGPGGDPDPRGPSTPQGLASPSLCMRWGLPTGPLRRNSTSVTRGPPSLLLRTPWKPSPGVRRRVLEGASHRTQEAPARPFQKASDPGRLVPEPGVELTVKVQSPQRRFRGGGVFKTKSFLPGLPRSSAPARRWGLRIRRQSRREGPRSGGCGRTQGCPRLPLRTPGPAAPTAPAVPIPGSVPRGAARAPAAPRTSSAPAFASS